MTPEPEFIHYESPAMVTIAMIGKSIASIVVMDRDGKQHVLTSGK